MSWTGRRRRLCTAMGTMRYDATLAVALTRAHASRMEVWPLRLQDRLPVLPVPLASPDEDVLLDLSLALTAIYDEAAYELSIDYRQPPPPPALSEAEAQWLQTLLGL